MPRRARASAGIPAAVFVLLGLSVLVGLFAPRAAAAADAGGLFRLVDASGRPVAGVRVSVVGRTGSVVTSPSGSFRLDPLPVPPFDLGVADGRGSWLGIVRVAAIAPPAPTAPSAAAKAQDVVLPAPSVAEEVFVTAGLAPATQGPPASAPTVISRRDLEERQVDRLADAIRDIPGTGRIEDGQSVVPSVRGLARSRSLLMIDDARVTAERRAGPSATYLDPFLLENVEIVRGPGSVAYGSDALGGVVHARTPMPDPSRLAGAFNLAAGFWGEPLASAGVEANVPAGPGALLVQAHQRSFADQRSPEGTTDNSAARDHGFLARYLVDAGEVRLFAGVQIDRGRDIGKPSQDSYVTRAWYPLENSGRFTLGADLPGALGFSSVELRAFFGTYRLVTNRDKFPVGTANGKLSQADICADDLSFRVSGQRPLLAGLLRTGVDVVSRFGFEAYNHYTDYAPNGTVLKVTDETAVQDASKLDAGVFVETDQPLVRNRLDLAVGLRGDGVWNRSVGGHFGDQSTSDFAPSGFLALTATPAPAWSFSLQYAHGYRDPLLSDRYFRGVSGRGFVVGNPALTPETTNQFDLAARYGAGPLRLAAYGYLYRIRNLVERYQDGADFYFRNRGEEEIRGVEIEAGFDVTRSLSLRFMASWLRGEILDDGSPAADIPPASVALTVDGRFLAKGWYRVRGALYARNDRPGPTEIATPSYGVIDLSAGWTVLAGLDARVVLRNLLNKWYPATPDALSMGAPGFSATFGVSGRF